MPGDEKFFIFAISIITVGCALAVYNSVSNVHWSTEGQQPQASQPQPQPPQQQPRRHVPFAHMPAKRVHYNPQEFFKACPSCEFPNNPNDSVCFNCNTNIENVPLTAVDDSGPQNPTPDHEIDVNKFVKQCPVCEWPNNPNFNTCSSCSSNISDVEVTSTISTYVKIDEKKFTKICPACFYDNNPNLDWCYYCPSDIKLVAPTKIVSGAVVTDPTMRKICSTCYFQNPSQSSQCTSCGRSIASVDPTPYVPIYFPETNPTTVKNCPHCTGENPPHNYACEFCRADISAIIPTELVLFEFPEPPQSDLCKVCIECTFENPPNLNICNQCYANISKVVPQPATAIDFQVEDLSDPKSDHHPLPLQFRKTCPTCTFVNDSDAKKCEMCETDIVSVVPMPTLSQSVNDPLPGEPADPVAARPAGYLAEAAVSFFPFSRDNPTLAGPLLRLFTDNNPIMANDANFQIPNNWNTMENNIRRFFPEYDSAVWYNSPLFRIFNGPGWMHLNPRGDGYCFVNSIFKSLNMQFPASDLYLQTEKYRLIERLEEERLQLNGIQFVDHNTESQRQRYFITLLLCELLLDGKKRHFFIAPVGVQLYYSPKFFISNGVDLPLQQRQDIESGEDKNVYPNTFGNVVFDRNPSFRHVVDRAGKVTYYVDISGGEGTQPIPPAHYQNGDGSLKKVWTANDLQSNALIYIPDEHMFHEVAYGLLRVGALEESTGAILKEYLQPHVEIVSIQCESQEPFSAPRLPLNTPADQVDAFYQNVDYPVNREAVCNISHPLRTEYNPLYKYVFTISMQGHFRAIHHNDTNQMYQKLINLTQANFRFLPSKIPKRVNEFNANNRDLFVF